jgi:hypothetical protein
MKHHCVITNNLVQTAAVVLIGLAAVTSHAAEPVALTNSPVAVIAATSPVVSVKEYLKDPAVFAGRQIVLKGFVTEVCRRKGCWALLHDADSEAKGQVRVKQNEEGKTFKAFLPELQGRTILVTAEVKETKIDTAYLDKWENNVKAAKEKAEKTPGETNPQFDATLKQIATYRDRLAKSERGWLASYSVAVLNWHEAE